MTTLEDISHELQDRALRRRVLSEKISAAKAQIETFKGELVLIDQAQPIIQEAGSITQKALEFKISSIGSNLLSTIFQGDYKLIVRFVPRANRLEADIIISNDGVEIDPMTACGGGIVDIISLSFRISLWALHQPKTRNVMVLDEPFKNVSKGFQANLIEALREISQEMGIQFIIVTHEDEIAGAADRTIEVSLEDKAQGSVVRVTQNTENLS